MERRIPTLADVLEARRRISPHLRPTPLYRYAALDDLLGAEVFVKHESHQPVGASAVAVARPALPSSPRQSTRRPGSSGSSRRPRRPRSARNLVEAAGTAPLAAGLRLRGELAGKRVALILSGGNASRAQLLDVLGRA